MPSEREEAESLLRRSRHKLLGGAGAVLIALTPVPFEKGWDAVSETPEAKTSQQCFTQAANAGRLLAEHPHVARLYAQRGEATRRGLPSLTADEVEKGCDGGAEDVLEALDENAFAPQPKP